MCVYVCMYVHFWSCSITRIPRSTIHLSIVIITLTTTDFLICSYDPYITHIYTTHIPIYIQEQPPAKKQKGQSGQQEKVVQVSLLTYISVEEAIYLGNWGEIDSLQS